MPLKSCGYIARWVALAAACQIVSGCAMMQLASSDAGEPELHSRNCAGLAVERHEHATRITTLQAAVGSQLASPPDTLVNAWKRMGGAPETGTSAYSELQAERSRLASVETAANNLHCPISTVAKLP